MYITGSTAFRANVYAACSKLYSSAPTIYYGSVANGGNGSLNSSDSSWVMTGSPVATLTNFSGDTLKFTGLFTGSIQGLKSVQQGQQLIFAIGCGQRTLCDQRTDNRFLRLRQRGHALPDAKRFFRG